MPDLRHSLHLLLSWSALRSSLLNSVVRFSCSHCWHFFVRGASPTCSSGYACA